MLLLRKYIMYMIAYEDKYNKLVEANRQTRHGGRKEYSFRSNRDGKFVNIRKSCSNQYITLT